MRNSVALFMSVGAAGLIGLASPGARVPDMTATPAQASGLVYVSGITGHLPGTTDFPEGIAAQTRQALENLDAALREKGADLSRVASTNVFLTDTRSFAGMNEVYRSFFAEDPPTRATVQADLPDQGALIQISVVAVEPGVAKRVVTPGGMQRPGLPYSWGIHAGNTLFIAGATSRNPESYEPVAGDMETQTRQVMQNIGAVLESAGMGYEDIVSCKAFLDDAREFQAMSRTYTTFFEKDPPARAATRAGLMNPIFRSEIQCVAVDDPTRQVVSATGPPRPGSALSPAIQVGDRLYLAGMLGRGPDGYAPGDVVAQTRQALENLRAALNAADLDLENVVEVTIWVTDIRFVGRVHEVYEEVMAGSRAAVTTVGSGLMSTSGLIEIMMTAER